MNEQNNNQIEIIKLSPDRWSEYKVLRLRALKEDAQAFGESIERALAKTDQEWQSRVQEAYEEKQSWMLFAEMKGNLVGMMGAYKVEVKTANIFGVYIAPEARGLGLGKKLINQLTAELQQNNISLAKLSVNKVQTAALKLYEGAGFIVVGEENVQLGDGNFYDEFIMEKKI